MTDDSGSGRIYLAAEGAVYLEIPKVACTSIKVTLARLLRIDLTARGGDPHAARYPAPPGAPSQSGAFYSGLFTFAFVRNPWDRLVSCYRDKIAGEVGGFTYFDVRPGVANCLARFDEFVAGMSFDEFVDAVVSIRDDIADGHFRSQYTFVTNARGEVGADFVGRFEQLQRDFEAVGQRLGLANAVLPRLQGAPTGPGYATYYTQRTRDVVSERYREDIELFGYSFEGE